MRRSILMFLLVLAAMFLFPSSARGAPRVTAASFVLMDGETGQVLSARNSAARRQPASITKIVTASLALDLCSRAEVVEVSREAAAVKVGSDIGLRRGDKLLLIDLVKGALISSGNDAAYALAKHVAGSKELFSWLMNRRARLWGAQDTHFVDPAGYSVPGHYTTAHDLAVISRKATHNVYFSAIVSRAKDKIHRLGQAYTQELYNTNKLLGGYPGANGIKTGTTAQAGNCLVGSARRDDRFLIAVVLKSSDRFGDVERLLDYGFDEFIRYGISAGEVYGTLKASGRVINVVPEKDIVLTVRPDDVPFIEERIILDRHPGRVNEGTVLGRVTMYYRGEEIGSTRLVARIIS